ncbi:MAG: rare lipoprotein, partial [Bacteroidota bacterium]|nr:rare lipoprotein [Bacteroidota bacterium]
MRKLITLFFLVSIIGFLSSQSTVGDKSKGAVTKATPSKDTLTTPKDTTKPEPVYKLKFYKKDVHASYYHDKFNGKRTSSGKRFDNNALTAAHRKFPFGTRLKITNNVS